MRLGKLWPLSQLARVKRRLRAGSVPQRPVDRAAPDGGNPRKDEHWRIKRAHFSALVDPSRTKGLEIGALDLPIIEPEEGRCDFADINDQDWIEAHVRGAPGHSPAFVVKVNYSVREGYGALPRDYDWIAAAHVVEHIPDIIGWLNTLADHLKPGGILFLTVPDKRYIFDLYRKDTTFAQVVARHRAGLTHPSFEQVFDSYYYSIPIVTSDVWAGNPIPACQHQYDLAMSHAALAEAGYVDAHCSVFTPDSFRDLMTGITRHGLAPFRLHEVRETHTGQIDFTAGLIRT